MKLRIAFLVFSFALGAAAGTAEESVVSNLVAEVQALRARVNDLERQVAEFRAPPVAVAAAPLPPAAAPFSPVGALRAGFQTFNPDISAVVDMFYHADSRREGVAPIVERISGFGQAHAGEEGHHHGGSAKGFNLRHVELRFSADVDPYFKGQTIAAVDLEGAEIETAEIETTCLSWGLRLRGGKFFSDFGYLNARHSHQWDFTDRPLIHQLALGDHGLNDVGAQASWLAPTPFYLLAGVEGFQGSNERMFAYHGEEPLPLWDGPRVGVGWLKAGPNLPWRHGLLLGAFGAIGRHQEEHDEDDDGAADHWLDGANNFWGADVVYKYDAPRPRGAGDVVVQGEYFRRHKNLEVVADDLAPHLVGRHRRDDQDGYYLQAVYGFLPRWRAGLRWEQVGLTNESELPDGARERFGRSWRAGAMLDFTPSEFSRLRLQVNRGEYETGARVEDVTEVFVQWLVSLGMHGAHTF